MSYRELHRRLVRLRRSRGVAEEPAYATVYRCLQAGRSRLDMELVADIVTILADDPSEAGRWRQAYARISGEAGAPAYAAVYDTLPDDTSDFTGRETEMSVLTDGEARILAIEGMAGVGKTTLAIRAAHRLLAAHMVDVVLSVNLAGYDPDRAPADPTTVLDGLLRSLGEPGPRIQTLTLAERSARYRELLADRRALVLLDNAATTEQVEPLLPDDPTTHILVTSRHHVVQRPAARRVSLDVFPSAQAIGLLRRRAGDAVDRSSDVAGRIVEQVGRLPLAVAIVASRIEASPGWTLDDHLEHLVERRESLRLDPGVELAFATSYETLPPSLKRLLRLLALHPGRDCDAYATAALADIDLDLARRQLGDLVEASLVGTRTADRFDLHDLVRVFALNRAHEDDPPSARRAALTRLFDHYRWATTVAMDIYSPEESNRHPKVPESGAAVPSLPDRPTATAWLDTERPNIVAAGAHAAQHGWPDHVGDLSALIAPYLLSAAHFGDAAQLHGDAAKVADGVAQIAALKNLAVGRWLSGARYEALEILRRANQAAEAADDDVNRYRVLNNLGNVYEHLGRFEEAREAHERALGFALEHGDPTAESRILMNLGIVLRSQGRYEEATRCLERSLSRAKEIDAQATQAHASENLGRLHNMLGQYDAALAYEQGALSIAKAIGERTAEADAMTGLGTAAAGRGDLGEAERQLRQALAVARAIGNQASEVYAHLELGTALRHRHEFAEALFHHQQALGLSVDLMDKPGLAAAHDGLAQTYLARGDLDSARTHWRQALESYELMDAPRVAELRSQLRALETRIDGES